MAQAGFTPISLYFSSTAAAVPTSGNLVDGEIALNTADMKLYAKNSAGTVTLLASSGGATGTVSSVSGTGTVNGLTLTGTVTTSGSLTLGGTLSLVSPPPIGSTTPNTGAFTTLSATGNLTSLTAQFGTNPAGVSIGVIGIPNQKRIYGRNAANSADVSMLYVDGSNGLVLGPTDTTVINSNGNVGVGTVSPVSSIALTVEGATQLRLRNTTTRYRADLQANSSGLLLAAYDDTGAVYMPVSLDGSILSFRISASEKGRFDASGNFIVGSASSTRVTTNGAGGVQAISETYNVDAHSRWYIGRDAGATGGSAIVFNGGSSAANVTGVQMWSPADKTIAWAYGNGSGWTETMRVSNNGGFSVGTTSNPGAGAIYATGAITAYYSDKRLKTVSGKIENALDKVGQLSGVYYTNNDTAKSFGYDSDEVQVGVIAQEVEAVLPQIVKAAPFDLDENGNSKSGQNYKTVQYEKLTPLLIEAINELRAEVTALKGTI